MKNDESLVALVDAAIVFALRGAREYLDRHSLRAQPEALCECVRCWVKIKLPEALNDAKEALACHMDQIAEHTFAATMIQAGIEAAKEAGQPDNLEHAKAIALADAV